MKLKKICCGSFMLILLLVQTAYAGHLADAFREFVLGPNAEAYGVAQPASLPSGGIAAQCMACHDGGVAGHIALREAGSTMEIHGIQTINHPVGMDYERYALKKPNHYTPSNALPPEIHLEDGKVTCISCHQLRPRALNGSDVEETAGNESGAVSCMASGALTVGQRETDLCFACHTL